MLAILVIGVFEALFLFLLLMSKNRKSKSDLFLGIILALYAFSIGLTYIEMYNFENGFPYPEMMNLSWLLLFLHGPALWLYIKSLSKANFSFQPVYLLHGLPFIIFTTIHYFSFIQLPEAEKIEITSSGIFKEQVFYKISVMCIGVSTLTYNFWALGLLRKHRQNLKQYFSKIEDFDLSWLKVLIVATLCIYLVNVGLFNLDLVFHFASYQTLMLLAYCFAAVYILVIGFYGLRQKNVFTDLSGGGIEFSVETIKPDIKPMNGNIQNAENELVNKLLSETETKQFFLDPELTITQLGRLLNIKTDQLSGILNNELGQNFFDFINKYRIEEFKIQCLDYKNNHLSIMGIAYNCGFNSKASFYRAFKKYTGMSPGEFIEAAKRK